MGLGADGDSDDEESGRKIGLKRKEREKKAEKSRPARVEKLNAKEVRRGDLEARRRGEKLKEMFYQREDVQKYLG